MAVKPIPEGYRSYQPYYIVDGAAEFIQFLVQAFGGKERFRMPGPGGRLGHAEVEIGDSVLMLADGNPPEHPALKMSGMLYVNDVDATFKKAQAAGAKAVRPIENAFYGDRIGGLMDKWGNYWSVATHIEDVPPEEMEKRMKQQAK